MRCWDLDCRAESASRQSDWSVLARALFAVVLGVVLCVWVCPYLIQTSPGGTLGVALSLGAGLLSFATVVWLDRRFAPCTGLCGRRAGGRR